MAEGRQTQRNTFSKCVFPIYSQCQGPIYLKAIGMNINRLYNSNYISVSGNTISFWSVLRHSQEVPFAERYLKERMLQVQGYNSYYYPVVVILIGWLIGFIFSLLVAV